MGTPKKGGDTPAKDAVVADVTGNGDVTKVENGDVKPEVTNGDVVKTDVKEEEVKEEVVEEAEKEKGEGDSKETEENPEKKESKATNLRKKLSFKKSFSFLRKKAAREKKEGK